ncbi:hypothetical protein J2X54_003180 [Duganella sp. 3397]|nr:hypothetical protein [Duganella sp. 3397]
MKLYVWIAAHAVAAKAMLVTHDNAFSLVQVGFSQSRIEPS